MGRRTRWRHQLNRAAAAVTALGTIVATGLLILLRTGLIGPASAAAPDDLLPALVAFGLLSVVGLAWRDRPTLAWLATIAASAVVTIDLATYARDVRDLVGDVAWRWMSIAISLSALIGGVAAACYAASRPSLSGRAIKIAGVVGVAVIGAAAVWAVANPAAADDAAPLGSLRLVTRAFLLVCALLTTVGVIGDVLPVGRRASRRIALGQASSTSVGVRADAWARAFADELAPGRTRARQAVLAERTRIAADLHADVVPGLRRALAEAQADVPPEQLAASLREALAEVEAIGGERHAIQLDIGGLVPALAWLAERVEARSDVSIAIHVSDPPPYVDGSPPRDVAAAAFRVAGLALENVVRHAPGSSVMTRVRAEPDVVDLEIADDGPGFGRDALETARDRGRRGVADMFAEAAACGAILEVGPGATGGTRVAFAWRRSGAVRGRREI